MADNNFSLEYVNLSDLQKSWLLIREGMQKVCDHSGDSWIPEDAYMSLRNNQSTLHIGYLNGEYVGFLILTPSQSYDGPTLHIWATYSKANDFCVFENGIDTIKQYANNLNAKRITFMSPRKGWEKHGSKLGFKPRTTQFAMEV